MLGNVLKFSELKCIVRELLRFSTSMGWRPLFGKAPFFSSKLTGRGLGLSVVLGIVKFHDGAITVESQVRSGSALRVYFSTVLENEVFISPDVSCGTDSGLCEDTIETPGIGDSGA